MSAGFRDAEVQPFGAGRGFLEHVPITAPAAGVGLTFKLDSTYIWRPMALRFSLTTDANAANRFVSVDYCDPDGNIWTRNAAGGVITANTTARFFNFDAHRTVGEAVANADVLAPLADFFIPGGWQIKIAIGAVQAGDQLSAVNFLAEKWITGGMDAAEAAVALRARTRRGR